MTTELPFRLLIVLLMGANLFVSGYYRRRADREGGTLDPGGNRVLLLLRVSTLVVVTPLLGYLIHPEWVAWARFEAPLWLRWLGVATTLATVPLVVWLFRTIGNNISPSHTTRENHALITTGPYRYMRHPLYTFGFFAWLGVGLAAAMWWLIAGLIILWGVLAWRTPQEEANLLEEFGESYRVYMSRTGRYLPRVKAGT